jgi:uncharacterized membrane protein YdjX (TVP38/TMEM64 family)
MKRSVKIILAILAVLAMVLLIAWLYVDLQPLVVEIIKNGGDEAKTAAYMESYGWRGVPVLLVLEVLMGAATAIPADPVHILIGACYGVFFGTAICLVGQVIGNWIILEVFKQFKKALKPLIKKKEGEEIALLPTGKRLEKMRYPEIIAFIAYLVPGIPNIVMPYLFAGTSIKTWRYLLAVTAGQIPEILLCTMAGGSLASGDWHIVIVAIAVVAVLMIIAFANRNKLLDFMNHKR